METIGSRIRAARVKAKLTQDQLAERLGRAKGAVSQWESNIGQPDYVILARLCEVLNVSADHIVRGLFIPEIPPETAAIATKIAALTPEARTALSKLLAGPAVPDATVEKHLPPAPTSKKDQRSKG